MLRKKDREEPSEQQALEQRVDAMLDSERSDTSPKTAPPKPGKVIKPKTPPLDIFKNLPEAQSVDPTTAPEVSDKLLKQIGAEAVGPEDAALTANSEQAAESVPDELAAQSQTSPESTNQLTGTQASNLDDSATGQAVDDIAAREADTMLAVQDAVGRKKSQSAGGPGWKAKLRSLLKNKWTWIGLAAVLIILFALPVTRYKLLGLVIKKSVVVTVTDSKTATPVSNAVVTLSGASTKTNGSGRATLKTAPGPGKLTATKQYYKTYKASVFVKLTAGTKSTVKLVATGRQVTVTVLNRITGKPLANAEIKILKTSAKTDARGRAVIVLPTTTTSDNATIQLNGYNTAKVSVQVTSSLVPGNTFNLTPSGHVYFLSNLNGTIDVVKTNLDGSNRQVVLAGSGKEDGNSTSLLASRDWRYVVLKTRRSGQPALYLIDTNNDKLTQFDNSNANFNLIGWYGHNFMYDLVSNTTAQSQTGHEAIKSYDADHLQLNQLDQSQAEGNPASYAYQGFYNFYVLSNQLVYNTQWYASDAGGNSYDISKKNATIRSVQPGGQNKKDHQSFSVTNLSYIQAVLYQPQAIYYAVYRNDNSKTAYYNFQNQTVAAVSIDQSDFNRAYPTYLVSPSSNQTFWAELRDGKNTLLIGDANAQHQKLVASLDGYTPHGWYSDNYVLASKANSQLYIMPAGTLKSNRQPVKISDYYKPIQTYKNYGYGYGGL